jgi:hypothetical protein
LPDFAMTPRRPSRSGIVARSHCGEDEMPQKLVEAYKTEMSCAPANIRQHSEMDHTIGLPVALY